MDLPPGWEKKISKSKGGRPYYVHRETRKTKWRKPAKKPAVLVVKSAVNGAAHCSCGTCLKAWSKIHKTLFQSE